MTSITEIKSILKDCENYDFDLYKSRVEITKDYEGCKFYVVEFDKETSDHLNTYYCNNDDELYSAIEQIKLDL